MGLLDFLETPQGQALASGLATYAATAQRGTPWNNIGRGVLGGFTGYGNAVQAQRQAQIDAEKAAYNRRQQELLDMHYGTQYMNAVTAQQRAMKDSAERKSSGQALGKAFSQILAPSGMTVAYDDNADEYSFMPVSSPRGVGVTPQGQYTPITKEGIDTATGYDPKLDAPMPGGYRVQLPEKKPYDEKMLKLYSKAYGIEPADMLDLAQTMRDNPEAGKELLNQFSRVYRNNKSNRGTEKDPLAKERATAAEMGVSLGQYLTDKANKSGVNVTVPVNVSTEKKYGEHFASDLAKSDITMRDVAIKAPSLAERANQTLRLLGNGKAITGFGADFRLGFSKAMKLAGLSDGESAADTETLAADLANNTLDFVKASGLGSGNGFTDKDREFLEKAKGGNIKLEAETLRRLATLAHRAAQQSALMWDKRKAGIPKSALEGTGLDSERINVPALWMAPKSSVVNTPAPSSPNIDELLKKYGGK